MARSYRIAIEVTKSVNKQNLSSKDYGHVIKLYKKHTKFKKVKSTG